LSASLAVNLPVTPDASNSNELVTDRRLRIVATQSQRRPIRAKLNRSLV
jgi:hypothetical protein